MFFPILGLPRDCIVDSEETREIGNRDGRPNQEYLIHHGLGGGVMITPHYLAYFNAVLDECEDILLSRQTTRIINELREGLE